MPGLQLWLANNANGECTVTEYTLLRVNRCAVGHQFQLLAAAYLIAIASFLLRIFPSTPLKAVVWPGLGLLCRA